MTPPECSICMEIIDPIFGFDTYCGHTFHLECINRWCATNNSCPMCRTTGIIAGSQYYLLNSNDQDISNIIITNILDNDDEDNQDINNNIINNINNINNIINNNIITNNNYNNYYNNNYDNDNYDNDNDNNDNNENNDNRPYNLWSDNNINIIRNTIISNN
tara:strand:+ start:202 stop:684 length:483 start_codon:yes stop_codon:yes gene_type:complete